MSVDIRLKHSSTKDKAPVAGDLKNGELALSIHPDSPAAYIKDSDGNIVKLAGENSVSTDTDAVKKSETASQNMVGDLTLGAGTPNAEKITLEPSGESTFLGDMIVHGDAQSNEQGVKIQSGLITTCQDVGSNSVFRANTEAGGDYKIDLSAAGRASFAGDLYVGNTWDGLAPSTTPPITLAATGDGTFAGTVLSDARYTVGGDPNWENYTLFQGDQVDQSSGNRDTVFSIDGTGAATFDGELTLNTATANVTAFTVHDYSISKTSITFTGAGAGTFAGDVKAVSASGAVGGFRHAQTDGGYYLQDDAGNSSIALYKDGSITAGQTSLTTSGRQQAQAPLVLNNTNVDGYNIYSQSNGTGTFAVTTDGALFLGDVASPLLSLKGSDGSGTFAGDVVVGGDVAIGDSTTFRGTLGDAVALLPPTIAEQFETIISSLPVAQPFTGDATTLPADIPTPLKDAIVRVTTAGKINLNSDGAATFEGSILSSNGNGNVYCNVSESALLAYDSTANGSLPKVIINKSGDATFSGTGNGEIFISANTVGAGGYYRQKLDAGASGGVWRIMDSTAADVAAIQADGSGSFAGDVSINGDRIKLDYRGVVTAKRGPTNEVWQGMNADASDVVTSSIFGNGSATFAGRTDVGGNAFTENVALVVTNDNSATDTGTIYAKQVNSAGNVFVGRNASDVTSSISGNGAATFAGNINANGGLVATGATFSEQIVVTQGSNPKVSLDPLGYIFVQSDRADTATPILDLYNSTSAPVAQIFTDGSSKFAGSIQSGGIPYNGDRGVATSAFGTVYVCSTASGELWQGYTESNTTPTSSIFGNGNATFTGTVTATVVPPSDARFKENIAPAKPQLADVVALGGILSRSLPRHRQGHPPHQARQGANTRGDYSCCCRACPHCPCCHQGSP